MTTLWLGRDGYNGYSYRLFECKPKRKYYRRKNKDSDGILSFTTKGRCCNFSDQELDWVFGSLKMEVGDVVEVEITVKRKDDDA